MTTLKIQKADGMFEFLQLAGEEFADIGHQVLDVKSQLAHTTQDIDLLKDYTIDTTVIADAKADYVNGAWVYTAGTDMSDVINHLIQTKNVVRLPKGNIYLTKPLQLRTGTVLEGQVSANGKYLTRFIFNGGLDQNCIEVDSSFEVSHYKIRFIRMSDVREIMKGQAITGGYGVFANNAVNSQLIEDCFIDGFGHGAIHVGANSTARAGDNIVVNRCWVAMGKVTKRAIAIGNFNNTCTISNIYADGDGIVVDRYLGNYLTGTLHLSNIKHELWGTDNNSTFQTIKTQTNDQVFASNIIRRHSSVNNTAGAVVKPVSDRGVYINCSGQFNFDGTQKGTANIFRNSSDTVVSVLSNYFGRTTFGEFITVKDDVRILSGTGSPEGVITAKAGSLYIRTDGSFSQCIYIKEQNSAGNTGWKEIQTMRSGATNQRPTGLGHTPQIGYMYFDTSLGKPIWFKGGTTWVDANGTTV